MARAILLTIWLLGPLASLADTSPPKFRIDLDAPAEERWGDVVNGVLDLYGWEHSFQPLALFMETLVPASVLKKLEPILDALSEKMAGDYGAELRGIHSALEQRGYGDSGDGKGLSLAELVVLNLLYELTVWCTSILALCPQGAMLHGRNLDYALEAHGQSFSLQNTTADVEFWRRGEVLYEATTFVGYVGVLTGQRKPGGPGEEGWTVSVDEREYLNDDDIPSALEGYVENLLAKKDGGLPVGLFLRDTIEAQGSYSAALPLLGKGQLVSPAYIIVGGTHEGEGAVITRNRDGPDESTGEGVWKVAGNAWYRVETNYDHWLDEGDVKNQGDLDRLWRRNNATKMLDGLGQEGMSLTSLEKIMKTVPVLNSETVYTTIMSAHLDYYQTTVIERCWDDVFIPCAVVQ